MNLFIRPIQPFLVRMLPVMACLLLGLTTQGAVQSLSVNVIGSGSVLRNPALAAYPKGAVVSLTALPAAGWKLEGWEGDGSGAANPLNLLIDGDKTVTARFVPKPKYSLTLKTLGSGTIDFPPGNYTENSLVTMTASPALGWVFADWSGDVTGTDNPLTLLIRSNTTVTARFGMPPRITVQPVNTTVAFGRRALLEAQFNASSPVSLRWFFNNTPLDVVPTPSLLINPATSVHEGDYFLMVSNAFGVARSDSVHLSVTGDCSGPSAFKVCDEPSLREAVARGGLIQFCCNGTITLTRPLEITKDVGLDARNQQVVLNGAGAVRLVQVQPGVRFAATNISFSRGYHEGAPGVDGEGAGGVPGADPVPGGDGEGGAIYNDRGTVTLAGCLLVDNRVKGGAGPEDSYGGPVRDQARRGHGNGGAILNHGGQLLLISCSLRGNSARDGESRPEALGQFGGPGGEARGGAIHSRAGGVVLLTNVLATRNLVTVHASEGGHARGGAFHLAGGSMTLHGCTLTDNSSTADASDLFRIGSRPARASGGAIFVAGGLLTVARTEITGGVAQGSQAARHSGTGEGRGGGICSEGECLILDSILRFNKALAGRFSSINADGLGGALYSAGSATVLGSTFQSNQAVGGDAGSFGGIFPDYTPGNGAGGAIYNAGTLRVTNTTLVLNQATGGARVGLVHPSGNAFGGGIYNTNGVCHLMNVTLASNQAISSPGEFETPLPGVTEGGNLCNGSGVISLRNTILDRGQAGGNGAGNLTDAGFNMSSDGSCQFASGTSFNLTDPMLLNLADNGGPTPTLALHPDSPAIDFGTLADAPSVDQRGRVRPFGVSVDMGAYEQGPVAAPVSVQLVVLGTSGDIQFPAAAGVRYELFRSANLVDWEKAAVLPASSEPHPGSFLVPLQGQQKQFYRVNPVIP